MTNYKQVAKKLGCTFRVGKYGFKLLPNRLPGQARQLMNYTSLDGWIFDPNEIARAIRLDDDMGVTDMVATGLNHGEATQSRPSPALQKERHDLP